MLVIAFALLVIAFALLVIAFAALLVINYCFCLAYIDVKDKQTEFKLMEGLYSYSLFLVLETAALIANWCYFLTCYSDLYNSSESTHKDFLIDTHLVQFAGHLWIVVARLQDYC